jgi:RNA polymerase sigma-70 factor (ECF subfamily)
MAGGARDAFERAVEAHRGEILGYLRRMLREPHSADDLCQDVFLRAYRGFGGLGPDPNVRAWLYKIATRTALNALRQRRRRGERVALDAVLLPDPRGADVEARQELRRVIRAVERLPAKQRAALIQRRFQGMRYAEIAAALGCSEAAARANVYQAVKRLREMVDHD